MNLTQEETLILIDAMLSLPRGWYKDESALYQRLLDHYNDLENNV